MVSYAVKRAVIHLHFLANEQKKIFDKSHPFTEVHTHYGHAYANTHIIKSNAIQSGVLQSQ